MKTLYEQYEETMRKADEAFLKFGINSKQYRDLANKADQIWDLLEKVRYDETCFIREYDVLSKG